MALIGGDVDGIPPAGPGICADIVRNHRRNLLESGGLLCFRRIRLAKSKADGSTTGVYHLLHIPLLSVQRLKEILVRRGDGDGVPGSFDRLARGIEPVLGRKPESLAWVILSGNVGRLRH